jgi:hypothetical protein
MNFNSKVLHILSILMLVSTKISLTYDNPHFYRARFFESEPRFDRNYLSSFDITAGGGSACKGLNAHSQTTCLLDICGCYNMQYLGKNVQKDLTKASDLIIQQLEQVDSTGNSNFALLSFSGEFNTFETDLSFYQNLKSGFFLNLHMPIRKLEISKIKYKEVTNNQGCSACCNSNCANNCNNNCASLNCNNASTCPTCADNTNPYWQAFLNSFNTILSDHGLSIASATETGLGDVSAVLGYTINYEDSDSIDFIDSTFKLGIITPTSKIKNEKLCL